MPSYLAVTHVLAPPPRQQQLQLVMGTRPLPQCPHSAFIASYRVEGGRPSQHL